MVFMQRSIRMALLFTLLLFLNPLTSHGDPVFVLWVKGSSHFIKEAWHVRETYDTLDTCNEARIVAFKEALVSIENQKTHASDMKLTIDHENTEYVTTEPIGGVYNVTTLSFHCLRGTEDRWK